MVKVGLKSYKDKINVICNFVKWVRFFYDSNEVLFSFFNMVLSKKQKYYLIGVRLMLECLKLSTISGLKLMSFALMFILWNEKLDR